MKVTDPWVLPIWTAVHKAINEGRTTHPGDAASQLALHLSTRLAMLPVIFQRMNEGCVRLVGAIEGREPHHEWTNEREGYALPIPLELQYGILVDLSNAPERHDLLIMKENLRTFKDKTKFIRFSELRDTVDGFERSKHVLQQHLIALFSE